MEPLARIQHLAGLPLHGRREPSVGDEQRRHGRDAGEQPSVEHRQHDQREGSAETGPANGGNGAQRRRGREDRRQHHQLLRPLGSDPRDEQQACAERAHDSADGVRRVDRTDKPRGIPLGDGHRRQRERKARAPEERRGQHRPQRADEIHLEVHAEARRQRGRDGPVRKRHRQLVRRPGDGGRRQQLTARERHARPRHVLSQHRPGGAAAAKTDQERGQDDRERVDRRAEEQADLTRPDHLAGERGEPRQRDGEIHRPDRRPAEAGRDGRLSSRRRVRLQPDGPRGQYPRHRRDDDVQPDRHERGRRHVVVPQQIEACAQAPADGARDVPGVEPAEPRHALGRRLDPARYGRQRGAHQHRRRQQAHGRDDAARQKAAQSAPARGEVHAAHERHREQEDEAACADAELEQRVHAQRMTSVRDRARQPEAAEAHPAHERAQQDADRHGRRPDHELEQLEPDGFVDESRGSAADEQEQQRGEGNAHGRPATGARAPRPAS